MAAHWITFFLFAGFSALVYRDWTRARFHRALLWVLFLSFITHINGISYFFLNTWDEAYHAVVAKNLIDHPLKPTLYEESVLPFSPGDWQKADIWLHKPPLSLWFMAISMKAFGITEVAARIPSLIFSLIGVYLSYLLGKQLFSPRVGVIAAYLHAINGMLFKLSTGRHFSDHVDTLFILLIQIGVLIVARTLKAEKKQHPDLSYGVASILVGVAVGLAFLTKLFAAFLPWLLLLYSLSRSGIDRVQILKYMVLSLGAALLIISPWNLYTYIQWPELYRAFTVEKLFHLTRVSEGWGGSVFFHWARIPRYFGELSLVSLPIIFYLALKTRNLALRFVCLWFLIPYVIYSLSQTKGPAYPFIASPAIFLMNGYFIQLADDFRRSLSIGRKKRLVSIFLIIFIGLNIRISLESQRLHKNTARHLADMEKIKTYCQRLNLKKEKLVLFGVPSPQTMFYCDYPAYREIPDDKTIQSIQARGYRVIVSPLK